MVEILKDSDVQAVILTGGKGTRMGEYTKDRQKCMLNVDGAPIIEHILIGLRSVFGRKIEVIIATGYRGEDIKKHFGESFAGMRLLYVHDDRPLETRGRLMLAKGLLARPFLFLVGDILTPDLVLENIASRFEKEQSIKKNNDVLGVIAGSKNHSPALSHALLTVSEGYLEKITYPPTQKYSDGDLREMHRAVYSLDFLEVVNRSSERLLSKIIQEVVMCTKKKFAVEEFDGLWAHYVEPDDLRKYQNLPFLNRAEGEWV